MKKNNLFAYTLITLLVLSLFLVRLFYRQLDVRISDSAYFGNILLTLFGCALLIIGILEIKLHKSPKTIFSTKGLLTSSLSILLILSIFQKGIGIYATAFFVFSALVYALVNGKVYALNRIYFFVFAYAVLEIFGTIGTPKGFSFPEMTYSFYIIPLTFCCFRLEKETLLHILRFVFRIMLVFMTLSIMNWYYNILHTDIRIVEWLTKKVFINFIPAYDFISSWSHYNHPSYINLVLLPTLIAGFYIHHKKLKNSFITNLELTLYTIFCVFFQLIMESRFGLVGVGLLLIINGLYYLHLKKFFFKVALFSILISGGIGLLILENSASSFVSDPIRKTDSTLAINYIKRHVWWGAGYQQEASVLIQQEKELNIKRPEGQGSKTYTHNQLLGTMIQFGIPGAIVLLLLIIGLFWYALRTRSYLLQMFVCLYFLVMLIEEPLYVQEGITRFLVFLGFFIHIAESEQKTKSYPLFNWLPKSQKA